MRKLFRSFDRFGVEHLLISGQASVLYGAATFSEDVDVWIRPTAPNLDRLKRALVACRARIHKLTPPFELRHVRRGHGFHFVIPGGPLPTYLDVMGRLPRVRSFEVSRRRARTLATAWGRLPVVCVEDLVALKKTRRLADYEVISNLAQIRLAEEPTPAASLLRWAAANSFRAEDRVAILRRIGRRPAIGECRRRILAEIASLQARDTAYWRRRVGELRRLRRQGKLLPEGAPVADLWRM